MVDPQQWDRVLQIHDSLTVGTVAYSLDRRELLVTFPSTSSVWIMEGIPPEEFGALIAAPSIGQRFNEAIRPHYTGRRIYPVAKA